MHMNFFGRYVLDELCCPKMCYRFWLSTSSDFIKIEDYEVQWIPLFLLDWLKSRQTIPHDKAFLHYIISEWMAFDLIAKKYVQTLKWWYHDKNLLCNRKPLRILSFETWNYFLTPTALAFSQPINISLVSHYDLSFLWKRMGTFNM